MLRSRLGIFRTILCFRPQLKDCGQHSVVTVSVLCSRPGGTRVLRTTDRLIATGGFATAPQAVEISASLSPLRAINAIINTLDSVHGIVGLLIAQSTLSLSFLCVTLSDSTTVCAVCADGEGCWCVLLPVAICTDPASRGVVLRLGLASAA